MSINEMTSDLKEVMEKWLEGHNKRSRRSIQIRSKVGYQTISDILQGERNASLETVLAILPVVCSHEEELTFLKQHLPGFERHFKNLGPSDSDITNSFEFNQALKDEQNFIIITLALGVGTTEEDVRSMFDEIGVVKLNYLINCGFLCHINGRIKAVKKYFFHNDAETVLTLMNHFIKFFDREGIGKPGRFCRIRTDNISDEGKIQIHDILRECYEKISTIATNCTGNNVFYTGLIMSMIHEEGME